ncbi:MFS transporter [Solicola sp. PLA-1-18]|uniref:MFS transporter n=1 Tax=Solicola sp. PLA-1-18 TaxID=3380532 RepID=UPI003B7607F4
MTTATTRPAASATRAGRILVLVAIVLLASNLRAAVGSLGVLLTTVRDDLGMSTTVGGVLTTLPVLCFAFFGAVSGDVARRVGLHRTVAISMALVVVGLVARAAVDTTPLFLLFSGVALAGGAVGNVLLPALAKEHFPDRLGLVSSLYGATILGGAAVSSWLSVPVADAFGSWRAGLAAWAVLAAATLLPWLVLSLRDVKADLAAARYPLSRVARSPLAWVMGLFFAAQSAQAYAQFGWFPEILVDAGLGSGEAALVQGVIFGVGIPTTLLLPAIMRRVGERPVLPVVFGAVTVVGWAGVLLVPTAAPWLWAALLGVGGAAFTWVLAMLGVKSRTAGGTAGLSSFVQGLGYLVAAVGPFGTGYLHDLTGSWTTPIVVLMVIAVAIVVLGVVICRRPPFEDDLV